MRFFKYAAKFDLKNATGVDISDFAKKDDLASLNSEVDELDIGKFKTTPLDLTRLSDLEKNKVVKNTTYDELIKKVDAIQAINSSDLVKKTDYNKKLNEIEKKILDHGKYITTQEFNKLTSNILLQDLNKQI